MKILEDERLVNEARRKEAEEKKSDDEEEEREVEETKKKQVRKRKKITKSNPRRRSQRNIDVDHGSSIDGILTSHGIDKFFFSLSFFCRDNEKFVSPCWVIGKSQACFNLLFFEAIKWSDKSYFLIAGKKFKLRTPPTSARNLRGNHVFKW